MKQNGFEQDRAEAGDHTDRRALELCASESTRVASDLARRIAEAEEHEVVEVPPGAHRVRLSITRSITLTGARWGESTLEGEGGAPVIEVRAPGARVTLRRLTLQGGAGRAGGGVSVEAVDELQLDECVLFRNIAPARGGGALFAGTGRIELRRSILRENEARRGGAILVEGDARLRLEGCILAANAARFGGALYVGGGEVSLVHCTLADNTTVGTPPVGDAIALASREPALARVSMTSSILATERPHAALGYGLEAGGLLEIAHSLLPAGLSPELYRDRGGNLAGDPGFEPSAYTPGPTSRCIGIADPTLSDASTTDLLGRARLRAGLVDAGALAHVGRARRVRRPSSARSERRVLSSP